MRPQSFLVDCDATETVMCVFFPPFLIDNVEQLKEFRMPFTLLPMSPYISAFSFVDITILNMPHGS